MRFPTRNACGFARSQDRPYGSDIGIGPSLVLGSLMDACDRDVDRTSAEEMSKVMLPEHLAGLDPNAVMFALPVLCLQLMQNFEPGEQAQLAAELTNIRTNANLTDQAKMRAVTVELAKNLGSALVLEVLTNARDIFVAPSPTQVDPSTAVQVVAPRPDLVLQEAKKRVDQTAETSAEAGGGGVGGPQAQ